MILKNFGYSFLFAVSVLFLAQPLAVAADMEKAESAARETMEFKVGNITVISLFDTAGEMPIELFSGPATPEQRKKLMPTGKAPASTNAFILKVDGKTILVDSGWGNAGKEPGHLLVNMAKVGIKPEDVSTVLLTHMHPDHISGLLKGAQRVFPKASILASQPEETFWFSEDMQKAAQEGKNRAAELVVAMRAAYGSDIASPFTFGAQVVPGVTAIAAEGHTPGHTGYLIESEGKSLLIIGDLIHAADLQFPLPDECAKYDRDPAKAVQSRKALLKRAADNNIPVAGMHIPFPGVGRVTNGPEKGFTFTPGLK